MKLVGKPIPRKEGRKKVTGAALYVDDLKFPGMLHGATVRSSVPRGRIKSISYEQPSAGVSGNNLIPWDEFTIVTARDVPGENYVALILNDQPFLADTLVNHQEEPIVLLAHHDKYLLEEARRHVRIEYEELPAVLSLDQSLAQKEIIWGDNNVFKKFLVDKGDVDAVWADADFIVAGEYETGAQEQLYIENNGAIAIANPAEGVTVWGSMQCPYYVHKALLKLFGLPEEKVRVIQTETGGGFGGKEEYPSLIAGHAALLSWKSGRPVKLVYDRAEDMAATTKRHPSRTRHRTAVSKDGKLLAQEIEFVIDGGAYCTLSPVVLSRGTIHAAGPYFCPNVRIRSTAVATNAPPHGAFRGFGAPQSIFALERHMDCIARAVNLSHVEIRRRNFLKPKQSTATGQTVSETIDLGGLLDRALELSDYSAKKDEFARENQNNNCKRSIGVAAFLHGAGFTGAGERYLSSVVGVEVCDDGGVQVLVSSAEFGQGTKTILCQIAAEALGLRYEDVRFAQADTQEIPDSGPTVASRTAMVVGRLVQSATVGIRQTLRASGLLGESYTAEECRSACSSYVATHGKLRSLARYEQPEDIVWDEEKYRGSAYAAFSWAVYVAAVTVDLSTYSVIVDDFVALQEVGRVLHPVLARKQIIN